MTPSVDSANRYLEEAMIQDLIKKYQEEGYSLVQYSPFECGVMPDLIFEKNGGKLVIEVVVRGSNIQEQTYKIMQVHKAVQSVQNVQFKTVFVNPPKRNEIFIDGLEGTLLSELRREIPNELNSLDTYLQVDEVDDVQVDDVHISSNSIRVTGSFVVTVNMQYGSNGDELEDKDSFPGTFRAEMDGALKPKKVQIQIDTSSWFGDL